MDGGNTGSPPASHDSVVSGEDLRPSFYCFRTY